MTGKELFQLAEDCYATLVTAKHDVAAQSVPQLE